jgi:hypothetical protein
MWMFLFIAALTLYLLVFWNSKEETAVKPRELLSEVQIRTASTSPTGGLSFEHAQYGLIFGGYWDNYCFSAPCGLQEAVSRVRDFFATRKAELVLEQGQRMLFSRGKALFKYLGGSDTWPSQQIAVSFEKNNERTTISIQYHVERWGLRTPPNQLRKEVLELFGLIQPPNADEIPTGFLHSGQGWPCLVTPKSEKGGTRPTLGKR